MIAYFGWTNTLIFNILNLRRSVYRDEPGHLFVIETDRIKGQLIDAVEKSGAFEKVVRIKGEIADVADNSGISGKLKALFGRRDETAMFSEALKDVMPDSGYETVVTAAFWSMFLGFYRELRKRSKNTEIVFVEEGYANYAGKNYLERSLICGTLKERVYRIFRYGDIYGKAAASVKAAYLYNPEAYMAADGLEIRKLCPFDLQDPAVKKVFGRLYNESVSFGNRRTVYFAGPDDVLEPEITEALFNRLPWEKMAYRDRLYGSGRKIIPEKALIDPAQSPAEPVIAFEVNDDSILIARNSTVLTLPKRMFGKEPWVIYTFGMYNIEKDKLDPLLKYALELKRSYSNQEKVIIAETAETVLNIINKGELKNA